jgi:organic radical activating enzyme
MSSPRNTYFHNLKQQSFVLKWLLDKLLDDITYRHVLDVGGSIGLAKRICIKESVETIHSVDPDRHFIENFTESGDDPRFRLIENQIETADLKSLRYDMAFMLVNLPWLMDIEAGIKNVARHTPRYVAIALQNHPIALSANMEKQSRIDIENTYHNYRLKDVCIDDLMITEGYYPLVVMNYDTTPPQYALQALLYARDKPDRSVYDNAKYIIQVNSSCNFNCPSCYVEKLGVTMDEKTFRKILRQIRKNDMICLRGGEPTLCRDLIPNYIVPALDQGAHLILESNGSFIGGPQYHDYLVAFSNRNAEIKISLDRQHTISMSPERKRSYFNAIAKFIEDAKQHRVRFRLLSLGMDKQQISAFLEDASLIRHIAHIHPITKYLDIKDLPINGKFIDIYGRFHDKIAGVPYSTYA